MTVILSSVCAFSVAFRAVGVSVMVGVSLKGVKPGVCSSVSCSSVPGCRTRVRSRPTA